MTPRETMAAIEGIMLRIEREESRAMRAAWITAALGRAKRLPRVDTILPKPIQTRARKRELERAVEDSKRLGIGPPE